MAARLPAPTPAAPTRSKSWLAAGPKFEQLALNDLADGSLFNGSPAVTGSRLLIRSDRFLYCLAE